MTITVEFKSLTPQDESFMWQMLAYAAQEASIEAVQTNPDLTKYVSGWGRDGDDCCFGAAKFYWNSLVSIMD